MKKYPGTGKEAFIPKGLRNGSLLIIVGNRECGIDYQLERIRLSWPHRLFPVRTYASGFVLEHGKHWYESKDHAVIRTFSFADFLTFYERESVRYYVHIRELRKVLKITGAIGLVGMPSDAFERFLSVRHRFAVPFHAIPLEPDERGAFTAAVMHELGVGLEEARMVTELAKQGSSIPPSRFGTIEASISHIRIRSPKDEDIVRFVEELLSA